MLDKLWSQNCLKPHTLFSWLPTDFCFICAILRSCNECLKLVWKIKVLLLCICISSTKEPPGIHPKRGSSLLLCHKVLHLLIHIPPSIMFYIQIHMQLNLFKANSKNLRAPWDEYIMYRVPMTITFYGVCMAYTKLIGKALSYSMQFSGL